MVLTASPSLDANLLGPLGEARAAILLQNDLSGIALCGLVAKKVPILRDDICQSEDLTVLASGLHIIGDGVQDEPTAQVRDALGSADEVCFLGVGYDPVNLGWLVECGLHRSNLRRYGSMLGMTGAETRHASAAKVLVPNASWDAKQFLREHEIFHDQ